jgi:5-methylthioribose kinase
VKKVNFYCELFRAVYERVSKVCPEGAREVALKIIEEIAKDIRSEQARQLKAETEVEEGSVTSDELATKKQREALHKFGIKDIPENLSKKEASEILDRLVGFSKDGDSESIAKFVEELNAKWKRSQ